MPYFRRAALHIIWLEHIFTAPVNMVAVAYADCYLLVPQVKLAVLWLVAYVELCVTNLLTTHLFFHG